jgi:hypothetical protein
MRDQSVDADRTTLDRNDRADLEREPQPARNTRLLEWIGRSHNYPQWMTSALSRA